MGTKWQVSTGTGGRFRPESVATFTGIGGRFEPEYAAVGRVPDNANLLAHINQSLPRRFLTIDGVFNFETEIPKSIIDCTKPALEKFFATFHSFNALMEELIALFRASAYLMFLPDKSITLNVPFRSNGETSVYLGSGGGLIYMESQNEWNFETWGTSSYIFPAPFSEPCLEGFNSMLAKLADIWHFRLWPIHRLLRALNAEHVEMENLLDLLFALEGLFQDKASSDFIRIACALFLGENRKESQQIDEALRHAYSIRNAIVHGAEHRTGFEKVGLGGRKVISQQVFYQVLRIVAGMIQEAISRLKRKGMRNLNITAQDIIEKVFVSRSH